jgi:hypothetical protein
MFKYWLSIAHFALSKVMVDMNDTTFMTNKDKSMVTEVYYLLGDVIADMEGK